MPRIYTMETLRTRCQQRCDQENSSFISDAEWNALISEQYGDLWSVVAETGLRYFETSTTITADGSASYDEPTDHYSTIAVTRVMDSAGRECSLTPAGHQQEVNLRGLTGDAQFWTLVDDQLCLYPRPSSGTYKWYYLQQPTDLVDYADDDTVDVVTPDGESFLIWGVAVKALAKGEGNVQLALAEREASRERLLVWAANRVISEHRQRFNPEADSSYPYDPADWRWR